MNKENVLLVHWTWMHMTEVIINKAGGDGPTWADVVTITETAPWN